MPIRKLRGQTYDEIAIVSGESIPTVDGLSIPAHDYIANAYTDGNLTSVTYKAGGASGTTVAVLTLTYDDGGNLLTITKS
jgi:hypothetical protein